MHPTKPPTTGSEPDPSRTRWARVAHTRSGFIDPTASADGDAPPLHDTAPDPHIDRKFSPTGASPHTLHSVTDETVILGQLGPDDDAPTHQVQATRRPKAAQRRPIAESARWHRCARWLPWSLALAVLGFVAVRLAVVVSDQVGSDLATVATLSMALCGSLLVVAQVLTGLRR